MLIVVVAGNVDAARVHWPVFAAVGTQIGPLIAGSLGEEFGWRGFAQPPLQRRLPIVWASVLVGVVWATWHLWPLVAPGAPTGSQVLVDVGLTYLRLISTAVVYGRLYNATGGSLLIVMLAHASHNVAVDAMNLAEGDVRAATMVALLYLAAAVAVVWTARSSQFGRPSEHRRPAG